MLYAFQKCKHQLFSSTRLISIKFSNVSGLFGGPCMSTMLVGYYAYTMSTIPVLCLYLCTIPTLPFYNPRHSFTGTRCCYNQRWARHFFRAFLKIVCGLVNQVTSHRFSWVNFAFGCQYFFAQVMVLQSTSDIRDSDIRDFRL